MTKKIAIKIVDKSLRDFMNNTKSFEGNVMVFVGDFKQILSIVSKETR